MTLILRDIAARKQAKAQLRSFIDDAPAAIAMFDRSMRYLAASTRWIEDYGLDADAVLGRSHYDVLPDIPERWKDVHRRALRGETIKTAEDRFDRAGAASIWLHWEIRPWYSASGTIEGVILFTEDITERKHAEEAQRRAEVAYVELAEAHERLHKTASDRAVLLRELSHRMRNDLAAVASLLAIQARALEDPAGQAALVAAGDRIQVLARVHQRLTMEEGAAVLDTKQFIADLCHDLRSSLVGFRPVTISVSAESHPITLQRAVALGLMINELLTNALKHAFPDGSPGQVEVKFQKRSSEFCLAVHDNGVGLAGAVRGSGMGQELVRALAQGLGGGVSVEDAQPGLQMTITFPADPTTSVAPLPT